MILTFILTIKTFVQFAYMLAFYSKKNYYFKTIFILILVIKYFIEVIYKKNKNLFEIRKLIKLNDRIVFMS